MLSYAWIQIVGEHDKENVKLGCAFMDMALTINGYEKNRATWLRCEH